MSNLKEKTKKALDDLAAFLADSPWRDAYVSQVHQLAARLDTPCVLAVAGEVKAGKSSFMNAFLKDDLALVGVTETTATINYFRYGEPPDKTKPVRCVWTDGRETWETQAFLDSLQGNTQEILERAVGIKHLEFYIPNPRLKSVQLVDTPGTGANIGEDGSGHEKQTRGYFQMLRDRHNNETQTISREADAVIYIMTGHTANEENVKFLQEFIGNGGVSSHNSVGIIAKVDTNDMLLDNLGNHVKHVSEVVNKRLPVPIPVLPISSGIQRVLDMKGDGWLRSLKERLLAGFESVERLKRALDYDERFDGETCRGSSLSQEERKDMHKGIPWRSFVVIARAVIEKDFDEAVKYLREIAGFVVGRWYGWRFHCAKHAGLFTGQRGSGHFKCAGHCRPGCGPAVFAVRRNRRGVSKGAFRCGAVRRRITEAGGSCFHRRTSGGHGVLCSAHGLRGTGDKTGEEGRSRPGRSALRAAGP